MTTLGYTQKVRKDGRIVNVGVVVAAGIHREGKREVLGIDVGTSEAIGLLSRYYGAPLGSRLSWCVAKRGIVDDSRAAFKADDRVRSVGGGESDSVEFKSALRVNLHTIQRDSRIMEDLQLLNVTRENLFPGLDSSAKSVSDSYSIFMRLMREDGHR